MADPAPALEALLGNWDGEQTVMAFDRPSGAWLIVAVHSTKLGPGAGGTRMRRYPDLASAVADAHRLAAAMTYKFAVPGFPAGGAKAVIALPERFDQAQRPALLRRYGALVAGLRGGYVTGPDVGTSIEDMALVAETGAPYVAALPESAGGGGDSAGPTALGVFSAIEAAAERLGAPLRGLRVLVQGLGGVGRPLLDLLGEAGAELLASDLDAARLAGAAGRARAVPPDEALFADCDILAPCAIGGLFDAGSVPRLRCRAIAGAANNQLAAPAAADWLRERGILYAPDFAINGGGAMYVLGRAAHGWSAAEADARIRRIGDTLREIFAEAEAAGVAPERAARARAERNLGTGDRGLGIGDWGSGASGSI